MISEFQGKYRFLSNFWPCTVRYEGLTYESSEHAYQAAKCLRKEDRQRFIGITAGEAKLIGKNVDMRPDWENVKVQIMYEIVTIKFITNPFLARALLETKEKILIEGNKWHDTFWGVCNGIGKNHLGKILMRVRNELKNYESRGN